MSSYLELCNKFRQQSGITGSDLASVISQTGMNLKIVNWIKDADNEIQNLWEDWKFLDKEVTINTVSGTDEYSLSALSITDLNYWEPQHFYIKPGTANYSKIEPFDYDEWLSSRFRLGVKSSNQPDRVVIKPDDSLVFIDKPDDAYEIWGKYWARPTLMSANASTSSIPIQFENIIMYKAQMFYALYYEDEYMYARAEKLYMDELVKLEANQLPDQRSRTKSANSEEDARITTD